MKCYTFLHILDRTKNTIRRTPSFDYTGQRTVQIDGFKYSVAGQQRLGRFRILLMEGRVSLTFQWSSKSKILIDWFKDDDRL